MNLHSSSPKMGRLHSLPTSPLWDRDSDPYQNSICEHDAAAYNVAYETLSPTLLGFPVPQAQGNQANPRRMPVESGSKSSGCRGGV